MTPPLHSTHSSSEQELGQNQSLFLNKIAMHRSDFEDRYTPNHDINLSSSSKRKKIREETSGTLEGIDRISELPDSILVNHILTLLPDTESAIRTGILSKRWQFLWTSLPVLSFSHCDTKPISDFISFVDNTLIHCCHSKLKKFIVNVSSDDDGVTFRSLDIWIRYAVRCNVEELELAVPFFEYDSDPEYKVPVHLFTNSTLTSLNLRSCRMAPSRQISWKMLKKLSIWGILLPSELIQNILLGSPMLESLELCRFWPDSGDINISSANLKELVLNATLYSIGTLEVSGPNILSLEIRGNLPVYKVALHNLPSLVKVCLDFYNDFDDLYLEDPDMWMKIFENISHVQELTVGDLAMKVLSSLELDGRSSPLSKRTLLKMNFFHRSYFPGLANLLQSSPFLERLFIDPPQEDLGTLSNYTRRNYLTCQNRSFNCLQKHLKFVKICYLIEHDRYRECELARFLLENASVLEKMVIGVGSFYKQSSFESRSRIRFQESERYLSFPRASKKAVLLINFNFR